MVLDRCAPSGLTSVSEAGGTVKLRSALSVVQPARMPCSTQLTVVVCFHNVLWMLGCFPSELRGHRCPCDDWQWAIEAVSARAPCSVHCGRLLGGRCSSSTSSVDLRLMSEHPQPKDAICDKCILSARARVCV